MDPLSITASIIAVLQATDAVIHVCNDYRSAVKNSSWELPRVIDEVTSLRGLLEALARLAKEAESADPATESRLPTLEPLCGPVGPLATCLGELKALEKKLALPTASGHAKSKRNALVAALVWPLKKEDTRRALENIERSKSTFTLAIAGDQAALLLAIKDNVAANSNALQDLVKSVSTAEKDAHRIEIHSWLSAPDPWSNYENALRKRQLNTGAWFTESQEFADWKTTSNSFLWIYGIPGCGKTILCSTIIEDVHRHCQSNAATVTVFFCFDFNDNEKQLHEKMMRSLVLQLSQTFENTPEVLDLLYSSCGDGSRQPTPELLLTTFRQMIQKIGDVFVILDALDECNERSQLLVDIQEMVSWDIPELHVLVTSRREKDIKEAMQDLSCDLREVCIQSEVANHDIRNYVRDKLQTDQRLKRWRKTTKIKEEIENELMSKANGMFRWAVCQIDSLANCLNPSTLRKALASLPETLDKTYERILCNIDKDHSQYALTILYWLCYSARPVKLEEINEVLAVDIGEYPRFDPDKRFPDPRDIWTICSSLVTLVPIASDDDGDDQDNHDDRDGNQDRGRKSYSRSVSPRSEASNDSDNVNFEIRLAHFSVKEYLLSDRIGDGLAKQYRIREVDANASIAGTCLAYLVHFGRFDQENSQSIEQFPLAQYAADYWAQHALVFEEITRKSLPLTLEFLSADCDAFRYWVRFHRHIKSYLGKKFTPNYNPLYWASYAGLHVSVRSLLDEGAEINASSGPLGAAALYVASYENKMQVVQVLIKNGADVNAQGGLFGNALQAAASLEDDKIVRMLLDHGVDVNAQGGHFGNALQAAAYGKNDKIVRLLLDHGADVNIQGGEFGNALQVAACLDDKIVRMLLDHGVDVNAQGGHFGNALQAAAYGKNDKIVRLLLDHGADVNVQGGYYGNALKAAAYGKNDKIVRLLLDHGADVDAQGGRFGNTLQAAAYGENDKIVRLLLDHGADVNVQDDFYGNALQAAAVYGKNDKIVRLLLDHGADVNVQGGRYGNALQAAAAYGKNDKIVRLLLDHGADVNAQGGRFGNALSAAARGENDKIVRLLLDHEANVNAQDDDFGKALQAAACDENDKIVRLLLDHEADVNAQDGHYGNALQAAAAYGKNDKIVRLLLDHEADVNAQGGEFENALQAAVYGENEKIVRLLLDHGADVNVQGGRFGNAINAAAYHGSVQILQLLLDNEANAYAKCGDAMKSAFARYEKDSIDILLGVATTNLRKKLADTTAELPKEPVYEVDTEEDILAYWRMSAPDQASETASVLEEVSESETAS